MHRALRVVAAFLFLFTSSCGRSRDAHSDAWATARTITSHDAQLTSALASDPFAADGHGGAVAHGWRADASRRGMALGARLPASADQPIALGLAENAEGNGDYVLHLTHASFAGAPRDDANGATYRDVAPSTDFLVAATDARVELFYLLHDAHAPRVFSMQVALPAGLPKVTPEASGALVFVDTRGKARLRMPTPFAVDARGTKRDATLTWDREHARIDVTLDPSGLTYPILLDPAVEHDDWEQVGTPTPSGRYGVSMAYDSRRGTSLLFGGSVSETWEWNGSAWAQRSVATSPPPRISPSLAYDSARGVTVLFGGFGATAWLNDTWEWDGTSWTQRTAATSPSVRAGAAMVYDSARGVSVLFGGEGGPSGGFLQQSSETWEWNGTTWTQRMVSGPSKRADAAMAYDSARGVSVLFGGGGSAASAIGETWEWNGTAWTQRAPAATPSPRDGASMAYDSARHVSVLIGGTPQGQNPLAETWEWDGTNWTERATNAPPARAKAAMAFDSGRSRSVVFGGLYDLSDTQEWDGNVWTQRSAIGAPSARVGTTMTYDIARGRSVLFGGYDTKSDTNDTWEWDGTGWSQRFSTTTTPGVRDGAASAYDAGRHVTVLFGGFNIPADTWEWNGTSWTQRSPATSPNARDSAAMAYDTKRGVAVLFGGEDYYGPYNDTWEWNGATGVWTKRTLASPPTARYSASLVYDITRARMVLFGGIDVNGTELNETWEWDGTTTWTKRTPSTSPTGVFAAGMAYDPARGKTILYGGVDSSGQEIFQQWEWDGTAWTQIATSASPGPRGELAFTFDSARGRAVLFGGRDQNFVFRNDTWEFHTYGDACTSPLQCDTGFCVDGVCCQTFACGTCQQCNGAGTEGQCAIVAANTSDPDSCTAPNTCSAAGVCGVAKGAACAKNADCQTGFCTDGVCCETACADDCRVCAKSKGGTADGVCDVAPLGSAGKGNCGVFACTGGTTCPTQCASDEGCASGYYCNKSGGCSPQKSQGSACSVVAGVDCLTSNCNECEAVGGAASGQCVDSVCCDSACNGACATCNASGSVGTCSNAAKGSAGGIGGRDLCAPYVCTGASNACGATCATNADCAASAYCDASSHMCKGTASSGDPCSSDDACASTHCVDKVCCQSACAAPSGGGDGGASACSVGVCTASTNYECELPVGTQCRPASCVNDVQTFVAVCASTGACGDVQTRGCAPFKCDDAGIECKTECTTSADCVDGATCNMDKRQCESGATCSADGTAVVSNNGTQQTCTPYVCAGNACKSSCGSVKDCVSGFVCGTDGQCAAGTGAGGGSAGCGCKVGELPRRAGAAWGIAIGIAMIAVRRRRRR